MELITINKSDATTDSYKIARGTGNQHKNVLGLIKTHQSSLELFGRVAFETLPFETAGGTQVARVAVLNEAQATLLMTLLRNSKRVVEFKVALVKAFIDAKNLMMTTQMGLLQKRAILSNALGNEKGFASQCGKGLSDWKEKRDYLQAAIEEVDAEIQPMLTNLTFID